MKLTLRKLKIYHRRNLKFDLVAGIVTALVAIPLCLGIALACGTSMFSGLLSGVIGGIIVGILSESHVSVSGPSAGAVAVVIVCISQLGSFHAFLTALLLSGLLQIAMGYFKVGFVAEYIPSNVIQGLLCAIGILLIMKQIPIALTHPDSVGELKNLLLDTTSSFNYKSLLNATHHLNPGAFIITVISLLILSFFSQTKIERLKVIPAPILVVIVGALINECFSYFGLAITQDLPNLVNIPRYEDFNALITQLQFPHSGALWNPKVYLYAIFIAAVGSLESLLTIQACEKLDKKKRRCSKDKELIAQGLGNVLGGLLGSLPITSVVVRSSVNIQAGSKTKFSAIAHGIILLSAMLLLPYWINKIPLACLAAILLHVGYTLASPKIFKDMYAQGHDRFISFFVTLSSIVIFNLLIGIIIGLIVSFFYILKRNSSSRIDIIKELHPSGNIYRLALPQQSTFLNRASIIAELDELPTHSQLIIDARHAEYIDKEIIQLIKEFKSEKAPIKKIATNLIGFKDSYDIHNQIDFINVTTYDKQNAINPSEALALLEEGNERFRTDKRINRCIKTEMIHTAKAQYPIALVLACIDSRVPVETVFDMGFGDLFVVRIAGNVINDDILGSIEFACHTANAKLIVVLGHTECGAISAAASSYESGLITKLLDKIKPAVNIESHNHPHGDFNPKNPETLKLITEINIANTMLQIYDKSHTLKSMLDKKQIGITGAIYDIGSGNVEFKSYRSHMRKIDSKLAEEIPTLNDSQVS